MHPTQAKEDLELEMDYLRKRLVLLQEEFASVETDASAARKDHSPRSEREELMGDVRLFGHVRTIRAKGVDASDCGLCVEFSGDLELDLVVAEEGGDVRKRGRVAWTRRQADGTTRIGFELVD